MSFAPRLDLADLDGSNGFIIKGIEEGDRSGYSVSGAGDINGDSLDDLIIGAPVANESYVVFGGQDFSSGSFNLSELNGKNGFVINDLNQYATYSLAVSDAGDVNGDGFDDVIIGASSANANGNGYSGASYVIFGGQDFSNGQINVSDLDGRNGFVINGINEGDRSGTSVSGAGDVNGDGFDDLLIGAPSAGPNGSVSGESYVVFGGQDFSSGGFNLSELDGVTGFIINGADERDAFSYSVSTAGDVDGDGFDDLLIGAQRASPGGSRYAGESYVVFGGQDFSSGSFDLSELSGTNGFVIEGRAGDRLGYSVSNAGDFNGDGLDDIAIGAPFASFSNNYDGATYLVFGQPTFADARLNLTELDGRNGLAITGASGYDFSGSPISGVGDINGDGFDDVIGAFAVGDFVDDGYVVFGGPNPNSVISLADLDGSNGFILSVNDSDYGQINAVSSGGDVNGDGVDDLILGQPGESTNNINNAGRSLVILSRPSGFLFIATDTSLIVTENGIFVVDIDTNGGTDTEGDGLVYALSGGMDQSLFSIDSVTGGLSFTTPSDFVNPSDADSNNTYEVVVTVTDSNNFSDTETFMIEVLPDTFTVIDNDNGDRLLFPEGAGEVIVGNFDIDEGFEFGSPESTFDTLSILDGNFQGTYSTTSDFLDLTFALEHDGDGNTDALCDDDDLIFTFGNGDSIRLEDVFGRDGLTVERFAAQGGDIFVPDVDG